MKILDKYLIKGYIKPLMWCLIVFIFLYIIIDIFEQLDEVLRHNVSLTILLRYYLYQLPIIFVQMAPVAILLSAVYLLGNLNRNNEITAIRTSGLSLIRITLPLLIISVLMSGIIFITKDRIVPVANINSSQIKERYIERDGKIQKKIIKNATLYTSNNQIIYARTLDLSKNLLKNIIILQHDEKQNLLLKTVAEQAIWKDGIWLLENVIYYKIRPSGKILGHPEFYPQKIAGFYNNPKEFLTSPLRSEFMSYRTLKKRIEQFEKSAERIVRHLKVDLYGRLAFSLASLIMVIIAIPFALRGKYQGTMMSIGICIALAFSYYAIFSISTALGKSGILPPFLSAWVANITFGGLGAVFLLKGET